MVNGAIEDMVRRGFGDDAWDRIRAEAGVDEEVFLSNAAYPDESTYALVGAAHKVLDLPVDEILKAFGRHWVLETARRGYGSLLRASGRNLSEFLQNLPDFHARVLLLMPRLQPPTFHCTEITDSSLQLHYITHRAGLSQFVVGLLDGLGTLYDTPVAVEQVAAKGVEADHDIFQVSWASAPTS
jgi:hypothetical protein